MGRPEQFRPITCLNLSYKALTGAASRVLMHHALRYGLLPEEQKALRKGRRGCLDALAIDQAVSKEKKDKGAEPNEVIADVLRSCTAPAWVQQLLVAVIPEWRTSVVAWNEGGKVSIPICFKKGLFQGDALSPLLFCLCAAPLSSVLRDARGVRSEFQPEVIIHLMFMDDLKVYARSAEELQESVQKVEQVSTALGMELRLKKCAEANMSKGQIQGRGDLVLYTGDTILELNDDNSYGYLGIQQLIR